MQNMKVRKLGFLTVEKLIKSLKNSSSTASFTAGLGSHLLPEFLLSDFLTVIMVYHLKYTESKRGNNSLNIQRESSC